MTPIRPTAPQPLPPTQTGQAAADRDTGKLAAQRAFFAALGKAGAPEAAAAPAAAQSVSAPTPAPVQKAQPTEAPQKILRPGSLLDIRV